MIYVHIMDYNVAIKRNEVLIHGSDIDGDWKYAKWEKPDMKGNLWFYFEKTREGKSTDRKGIGG
jgi:hypothetical protein